MGVFSFRVAALACATAASVAIAAPVSASTMTFDNLGYPDYSEPGDGLTWVENGITARSLDGGIIGNYFTPGTAHVDDTGTEFASGMAFTMGKRFTSAVFTSIALGYDMWFQTRLPFNVVLTGYFMGERVAQKAFQLSDDDGKVQNFALLAGATAFDKVTLRLIYPNGCAGAPCAHFDLDQVELAAVPLPAAGAALGAGLLALAGVARRRVRNRA